LCENDHPDLDIVGSNITPVASHTIPLSLLLRDQSCTLQMGRAPILEIELNA
jgi:hypothetical protein